MSTRQPPYRPFADSLSAKLFGLIATFVAAAGALAGDRLPKADMEFLRGMTRDVVEASRVWPGSNGGGSWPITNSCGLTLITPGKDTYKAFWPRDFSMSLDSGFITPDQMRDHLLLTSALIARGQLDTAARCLELAAREPGADPDLCATARARETEILTAMGISRSLPETLL